MSFGLAGNCITNARPRLLDDSEGTHLLPQTRSIVGLRLLRRAWRRTRFPRRDVHGYGVRSDVLAHAWHTAGAAASKPAESSRSAGRAEHRILIEVHRQFLAVEPVRDGTLAIREDAAHDGAASEELRRPLHRHACRKSAIGQKRGRRTIGDQGAAFEYEFCELSQALKSHSAPNVVGFVVRAKVW